VNRGSFSLRGRGDQGVLSRAGRGDLDSIFTHRREDLHQDHHVVSELTWCAFRDHLIFEYEIPKYEGELETPNVFVPSSESICKKKVGSILDVLRTQYEKRWFTEESSCGFGGRRRLAESYAEGFGVAR